MLIFDIGANVGNYTISNSENNSIVAIEASPYTFGILEKNLKSFNNVKCLHYAVCDSKEENIIFFDTQTTLATLDSNWLTSPESRFFGTQYNKIYVKTISIDKLIETYGIPDIIKIDVEGAEECVINSLSSKTPVLCFEWASEWKESLKRAIDHLVNLGFSRFHVQYGDKYTYYPETFELSYTECKLILDNSKPKIDWGMIWTS
jgi:FkbM family methyltransferase